MSKARQKKKLLAKCTISLNEVETDEEYNRPIPVSDDSDAVPTFSKKPSILFEINEDEILLH